MNNDFLDAASGLVFHYNQPNAVRDGRWWRGEPIWATAVKQGKKSAASFWVGSEAPIAGVRPTFWKPYDYSIPFAARLDELIRWLQLPPAERPAIVAFYLTETNAAGHRFGPDSPELAAAVATVDRCIGTLVARLHAEKIAANLIVVSDHGMTATARARGIVLEDFLPAGSYQVDYKYNFLAADGLYWVELSAKFGADGSGASTKVNKSSPNMAAAEAKAGVKLAAN